MQLPRQAQKSNCPSLALPMVWALQLQSHVLQELDNLARALTPSLGAGWHLKPELVAAQGINWRYLEQKLLKRHAFRSLLLPRAPRAHVLDSTETHGMHAVWRTAGW